MLQNDSFVSPDALAPNDGDTRPFELVGITDRGKRRRS
jgi:hypothetical protein